MKSIKYFIINSDFFGVLTCSLCILHCISAPLILISFSSLNSENSTPYLWWSNLDYVFITISFFLVYFSTRITKIKLMKFLFWLSWFALFLIIVNEKTNTFHFSEYITYLAAGLLSSLHLYNLKHCK
ncbi:MerC domain-containing protein [Flavobacteriaceae bacterium]|nr:MerC domain-containing protein [Flavobacteriaceae bacterium]